MYDQLATAAAVLALYHAAGLHYLAAHVDPYMWVAIPALYGWCAVQIRVTLERAGL